MKNKFLILFIIFCFGIINSALAEEALLQDIVAFYSDNNTEEAAKLLSTIPDEQKSSLECLLMGNIYEEQKDSSNSIKYYEKAITKDKTFYKAYYNLGYIYASKKDYIKALTYYKEALKYQPKNAYIYYNIGCMYINLHSIKKANKAFRMATELKNDIPQYYYNLAYTYKLLGDKKQTDECITKYNSLMAEGNQ